MKLEKLTDEELLPYLKENKPTVEKAFRILYLRYHIRIFEFFFSKLKNRADADDKHQDTFEKFFSTIQSGTIIENVERYIFTIAKNLYLNHEMSKYFIKTHNNDSIQKKTRRFISIDEMTDIENLFYHNDVDKYENNELIHLIKWAISQLELKYSEPYIDRKFDELTIREIAKRYNLSYDGAKKRIDRAALKIKEILKEHIYEISKS
jgi:RNA polymerase sigma-70 factor, ECF subfamily